MITKSIKTLLLFMTLLAVTIVTVSAEQTEAPQLSSKAYVNDGIYIVRLADAPLAMYHGGIQALDATSPRVTTAEKLDAKSAESVAYLNYLAEQQAELISEIESIIGGPANVRHQYSIATNGLAVFLTPAQAEEVASIPNVIDVQPNFIRYPMTDAGPSWIGAPSIWSGVNGTATMGEGMIAGIIDTGINMDHPSFADVGGDGYDHTNPNGAGNYAGWCNSSDPDYDASLLCNDKLIGVHSYPDSGNNPEDDDGHGSHTGSTTAGNVINGATVIAPTTTYVTDISGVAPHANVISYDVCTGSGCQGSSILAAIEDTVIDGVDVINYSIGAAIDDNPYEALDSLAFLAAIEAGVFVATSNGNSGPTPATTGSPANAPWMMAVGAATHTRKLVNSLVDFSGGDGPLADMEAVGFTIGYGPASIVYAGDYPNSNDPGGDPAQCLEPYPAGTFSGEIVVCDRGAIARVAKGQHVLAGGAGGYVLANLDAQGESTSGDAHYLPGVHIGDMAGDALREWLASGSGHMATITGYSEEIDDANADIIAGFSSRGPISSTDVIKPDIAGPGVSVLAAVDTSDPADPAEFAFLSGTSMSSPHLAGSAILMRAVYPSWSVDQVRSALMMTADQVDNYKEDEMTIADAFDFGAGRVDLTTASQAALVMDIATGEYLSSDPNAGGDPKQLNIASMQDHQCFGVCTFNRTVMNPTDTAVDWTATVSMNDGVTATVEPSAFSLAPGASQDLVVTVNTLNATVSDEWVFGQLDLSASGVPDAHMPIAIVPVVALYETDFIELYTRRDVGSEVEFMTSIEITDLTIEEYGLVKGQQATISLDEDPTNDDPFDDLSQVWYTTFNVPAGMARLVAETVSSTSPDMDLFWGMDTDGDGLPSGDEVLGASTSPNAIEYLSGKFPEAGTYWVLVQNWQGSGVTDDTVLSVGAVPMANDGNFSVTGPDTVPANTQFSLDVSWNADMEPGDIYYGVYTVGTDADNPRNLGCFEIDIHRLEDDVTKSVTNITEEAIGGVVSYEIEIQPNVRDHDLGYEIIDTLPAGLQIDAGSVMASSGNVSVDGNTLTWNGVPADVQATFMPGTTPFGGYISLAGAGIAPVNCGSNPCSDAYLSSAVDYVYQGERFDTLYISTNGYVMTSEPDSAADTNTPQMLPDPAAPNGVLAPYWNDFDLASDDGVGGGYIYTGQTSTHFIIEWEKAQIAGDTTNEYTFQIHIEKGTSNIVFVYGPMSPVTSGVIGHEDGDGILGVSASIDPADMLEGNVWAATYVPADPITIEFDAVITDDACGALTNVARHDVDDAVSRIERAIGDTVFISECAPTSVSLTGIGGNVSAVVVPFIALAVSIVLGLGIVARRRKA